MVTMPMNETPTDTSLPTEFTLHLGPHSSAQVDALARVLEDLGAKVERDADGGLVAVRPA